ncbi:hypothetical protein IF2G_07178 [Cordyceps javanica]|nr:hypothetical protein IF2G_07178 [Cordyceps javanica]
MCAHQAKREGSAETFTRAGVWVPQACHAGAAAWSRGPGLASVSESIVLVWSGMSATFQQLVARRPGYAVNRMKPCGFGAILELSNSFFKWRRLHASVVTRVLSIRPC